MKLSFILELLLVFVLVSFVASRTVVHRQPKIIIASELHRQSDDDNTIIDDPLTNEVDSLTESPIIDDEEDAIDEESSGAEDTNIAAADPTEPPVNVDDRPPINKYCSCSNAVCNCCRDFALPIVPVRGPGCAEIKYLKNDRLSVTVKYGDFVIANRIVKAGTSKPVCVGFPGGYSSFCGRIYGVQRVNEDFKACLGLELRSDEEVEAALRVSCFKFGERGLAVTEADPLPAIENEAGNDDDDDDDDLFGLGGGDGADDDDDDDDDDEDSSAGGGDDDLFGLGGDDDDEEDDSEASEDSPDYTGFSLISDGFDGIFGDDDDGQKKKKVVVKTKNTNQASVEAVPSAAVSVEENKNDKDSVVTPAAEKPKPITEAPVAVTTTKPKKKKPSGGILDALLGDDDDDDDEDEKDDDDDETDDDEEEDDDEDDTDDDEDEKEEQAEEDAEKEEETADAEDEDKDEAEDEKDEAPEYAEEEDDNEDEEDKEEAEDDDDAASNETDDSQKVTAAVAADANKKNKKKDDYYGYFSRLMKIF